MLQKRTFYVRANHGLIFDCASVHTAGSNFFFELIQLVVIKQFYYSTNGLYFT